MKSTQNSIYHKISNILNKYLGLSTSAEMCDCHTNKIFKDEKSIEILKFLDLTDFMSKVITSENMLVKD